MDSSGFTLLPECPPLNKPPGFNGQHYTYWKQKIKNFIEATDVDMWELVEDGYEPPRFLADGVPQPKPKSLWTEEEKKKHLLASKVKWIISNSLSPSEYERISNCNTAKEMWDTLEVAHVGTTQVKASKVHTLVSQYELFKMEEGETIKDLIQRFTAITNHLTLLGRKFENADLVHKILRSLTQDWQPKVTAIKESLKMGVPTIQELFGNLEEHEEELKRYKRHGDDRRKKSLALKAATSIEESEDELDEVESINDEDDMALLSKKLQRILKAKRNKEKSRPFTKKKPQQKTEPTTSSTTPTCFECKKPGHFKPDCPIYLKRLLENEKKKRKQQPFKKANMAIWGDEEAESGDEEDKEEEALLCLMALDDEIAEVYESNSNSSDDDLDDLYTELYDSLVKAKKELNSANKKIEMLSDQISKLEKENSDLNMLTEKLLAEDKVCCDCESYKAKISELNKSLHAFNNSKGKLNDILRQQTNKFNKSGLGYSKRKNNRKRSKAKNRTKNTIRQYGFINCYFCNQRGHHIRDCPYRNGTYVLKSGEKLMWVPKASTSTSTNQAGPKTTWVPSSTK